MDKELCEVKIPNDVVGNIKQFRNYDEVRIKKYVLRDGYLSLYMTRADKALALQEFKELFSTFYEVVQAQALPEAQAYCNFIVSEDLRVFTFYMKDQAYYRDLLTAVIEPALLMEAFYYQLYEGNEAPQVTTRYVSSDGAIIYAEKTYNHIEEPSRNQTDV